MWKLLRKSKQPSARALLLRIIPKVELVPVVVPEKYELPKNWKPPESKMLTMAAKRAAEAEAKEPAKPPGKPAAKKKKPSSGKKSSGKASPEAKKLTDQYEAALSALDEAKASNIINNA